MKWLLNLLSIFSKKEKKEPVTETKPVEKPKEKEVEKKYPISKKELEKVSDPIEEEYKEAYDEFYEKINDFRNKCGLSMNPTSYFRSKARQIRIYKEKAKNKQFPFEDGVYNESKVPLKSKHMTGYACDFADADKKLAHWVFDNLDWCKENGFYFENFGMNISTNKWDSKCDKTPTWLHIQIVPPKSGRTVFNP